MVAFHRLYVPSYKQALPITLYRTLADFPLHYVALAAWTLAWGGPADKVSQGGIVQFVSDGDVTALAKALKTAGRPDPAYGGYAPDLTIEDAEKMLTQMRVRLPLAGVRDAPEDKAELNRVLTRLNLRTALFLMKKNMPTVSPSKNLGEILEEFKKELADVYPDAKVSVFDGLWKPRLGPVLPDTSAAVARTALKKDADAVLELTAVGVDGAVTTGRARLRARGFELGHVVAEVPDATKDMWRIVQVGDEAVVLETLDTPIVLKETSVDAFLGQTWHFADEKSGWRYSRIRMATVFSGRPSASRGGRKLLRSNLSDPSWTFATRPVR